MGHLILKSWVRRGRDRLCSEFAYSNGLECQSRALVCDGNREYSFKVYSTEEQHIHIYYAKYYRVRI
jgi:predicted neuraminidase